MASPGGLTQIFKKPLPENLTLIECLSPVYQIRSPPSLPVTPALEFFGELNFFTKKTEPPSPCPPTPSCNAEERAQVRSTKNLQKHRSFASLCTEGLGFESPGNLDVDTVVSGDGESQSHNRNRYLRSRSDVSSRSREAFPPPISCIATNGKPWMLLKPYRKDGMLVLKEIRIARELHSTREDGRLRMHFFMQPDEKVGREEEEQGHGKQEKVEEDQTGLLNMKKRKMSRTEGLVDRNSDENYLSSIKDQYAGISQAVP